MLPLVAMFAVPPTLYVAPTGNDGASGTAQAPLRSLTAAVERSRPRHPSGRAARILLRPGTYPILSAVELGPADSGLVIAPERKGTVRLLGGRILTRWKPSGRPNVLVCDLSGVDLGRMSRAGFGVGRERSGLELFFDGKPMTLSRWPNQGWLRTGKGTEGQKIVFPNDRKWSTGDDVWAMGYWKFDWAETYERVAAMDEKGFSIGDAPPFGTDAGRRFYFVNVLEELDSPGEWYLDRAAKRLYFWPPSPKGEAVVSTLNDTMIRVSGASNVTIRGLDLEVGRANAVVVSGGSKNRIEGCLIRNFGTDGVAFNGGSESGIVRCDLTGMGTRAITLSGGDRKTLTPARLYADDNHIWAYSRWNRTYQPAIGIDGVGNRAVHNLIHDAPHNAVLLSGNDHLLEANDVRRVCLETGDSGAFYMGRNPTMRGTVIRGNRFRDLGARVETEGNFTEVMSVYLDDGWPGTAIVSNVFEGPGTGIMIGGGQDNAVEGNVFVLKNPAVHLDARGRGWAKDKLFSPNEWDFDGLIREVDGTGPVYSAHYPPLATYRQRDPAFPSGTRIVANVSVGGDWLRLQDGLTTNDVEYRDNVQLASGTLADALKRLARPIDLGEIGLRTRRGRPIEWRL